MAEEKKRRKKKKKKEKKKQLNVGRGSNIHRDIGAGSEQIAQQQQRRENQHNNNRKNRGIPSTLSLFRWRQHISIYLIVAVATAVIGSSVRPTVNSR